MRFLEWLKGEPARKNRAPRQTLPGLVACYWDGVGTSGHGVKDISPSGAYVYTKELWGVGTIVVFTLHAAGECKEAGGPDSVSLPCRIARHGPDGVGISFMLHLEEDRKALQRFLRTATARSQAANRPHNEQGQALVEFALMVPFLFLLILNTVNFGGFLYSWITISNAARVTVQDASMGAAYASYPATATQLNLQSLIQGETSSLPGGNANVVFNVCENQNGTAVQFPPTGNPPAACVTSVTPPSGCPSGAISPPMQDPEQITSTAGASTYTSVAVDIFYGPTPFIPAFTSGALSIFLPPPCIHVRQTMRVLN